ncbi:NYN domain-containing protein [Pseudoxanthomonas mexicana]
MQHKNPSREPAPLANFAERVQAEQKWKAQVSDKIRVIEHAMAVSGSEIRPHKLLILVDLQGMYLALHKWLLENEVPVEDGLILGRFALLQIERTAREIAHRLAESQPSPTEDLRRLFERTKIDYVDGKAYLGQQLDVLKGGTYLDISMNFELFYAPVPLKEIEWRLSKSAKKGHLSAKEQLRKIRQGIVSRPELFERNYKPYDDFVSYVKRSTEFSRSQEGFFGYYVGPDGLKNFDEKEVDIRIAIRAMDALHCHEADSICIVSSDQDFLPLHERARSFGVASFQADLAKFKTNDNIGGKLKELGDGFIQGGIDPSWPLAILTEAMSSTPIEHFASYNLSEEELHALCRLHNNMNEVKIELRVQQGGAVELALHRPD